MTKEFQKELLEKVKPGTKPSTLKKLKKSKSADDIPTTPASVPLSKSQSQSEISITQPNPKEQITQLKEQVKFHAETAASYLKSLQISQAKVSELEEKLKNNPPLNSSELDNSLMARHQNLKDWFTQYSKNKKLDKELKENVEEASVELIQQDQTIANLRGQVKHLELTNQSLTKDLNLATKLAEMRKSPLPENNPHSNLLTWAFLALWFIALISSWNYNFKDNQNE